MNDKLLTKVWDFLGHWESVLTAVDGEKHLADFANAATAIAVEIRNAGLAER